MHEAAQAERSAEKATKRRAEIKQWKAPGGGFNPAEGFLYSRALGDS
jgi:hypothetical protein